CTNVNTKLANGQAVTIQANEAGDQVKSLASRNFVDAPTIMIKRERFLELGGFDEDMKALEDWDLALRYAEKGKIGFIQEPLLEAELLDSGVSSGAGNYFDARARMIAKNRELLAGRGCLETALLLFMEFAQNENVLPQARQLLEYYTGVYVS
nr:hypothetical protein [Lachnospiraceae bacterium]